MGNFNNLPMYVLSICISVKSQYTKYQPPEYPYVLGGQQYQQLSGWQHVIPYNLYGTTSQTNNVPVNTPGNVYQGGMGLPYPYQYGEQNIPSGTSVPGSSQNIPEGSRSSKTTETKVVDPYAGVKTEIIDVDPVEFRKLMSSQGFQPQIVSYETRRLNGNSQGYAHRPRYIVKTEIKHSNQTSSPQGIIKYEVQSKVTSFNKTFVIHPDENGSKVLNLNFVNGVQVTESPEASDSAEKLEEKDEIEDKNNEENESTTVRSTTNLPTTTENENPESIVSWIDY